MNEIVRKSDAGGTRNRNAVSVELIVAVQDRFAKQNPYWVSDRLGNILTEPTDRNSEGSVRQALAEGEAMLANEQYQRLLAGLKPACVPATLAEIKQQLGVLLLSFPGKDDLTSFVEITVAEVATTDPPVSRLRLASAFRTLRRTSRFRPSISEILDAIADVDLRHVGSLLKLPDRVAAVRLRLARGDFARRVAQIAYSPADDGFPDEL